MVTVQSVELKRDELNAKFGGGIPRNSLLLMEGPDGVGKSILAQRMTFGFLQHGYTVTYISTELNTMGFIQQMNSVEYGIKDNLLNDDLLFIPMFPFFGDTEMEENFMQRIIENKKIFEKDIIIFDTLSYLIAKNNISAEDSFDLISFIKKLNTMDKTIIFCVDPNHLSENVLSLLRSTGDILFELEIKMVLGNLLRIVNVKRFKRSIEEVASAIPFKVMPKVGLAIELASLS